MQKIKTWLVENAALLGAISACLAIIVFVVGLPKIFTPTPPQLSAEEIAQKVIEKQADKKVAVLQGQVAQLTLAVKDLQKEKSKPTAPAGIDLALKELEKGNTIQAENIFRQVLQDKAKEGKEANKEAGKAARHLGALAFFHDTTGSMDAYQQAVKLDPENFDGWNQLGHLQNRTGDLDGALRSYNHVLRIGEAESQRVWLAVAYGNLGNIYQTRGDLEKAEEYYLKSLGINEELGRKEGMANQYGNLGIIFQARDDLEKAEKYYLKALAINEELGRKEGTAIQYANLGAIYETRGDLEEARIAWGKSKSLFLEIGAKPMVAKVQGWIDGL